MLTFKDALKAQRFTELFGNDGCCFGSPLPERYRGCGRNNPHNPRPKKSKKSKNGAALHIRHDKKDERVALHFSATKPKRKRPMAIRAKRR